MAFKIPWLAASDSKSDLPAQGAEDEVHNEKGPGEDQGDEVDPGPRLAHRVVDLDVCSGEKAKKNKNVKRKHKKIKLKLCEAKVLLQAPNFF